MGEKASRVADLELQVLDYESKKQRTDATVKARPLQLPYLHAYPRLCSCSVLSSAARVWVLQYRQGLHIALLTSCDMLLAHQNER